MHVLARFGFIAMNSLLVIIPTYNEADNVTAIVDAVLKAEPRVDILIVDDNSPDGTGRIADGLASKNARVKVLHRAQKQGLGRAYLHAFEVGLSQGYAFLIEMDADFSHDPKYLKQLVDEALAGGDVVIGSRWVTGGGTVNWGVGRQLLSRGGSAYARTILQVPLNDLTAGFMCFRRGVLEALDLKSIRSSGYGFQIELKYRAHRAGFKLTEVPIVFEDRRVGQSKMNRKIVTEALLMVWKLRFQREDQR
jgi:dolichol-phosphate mannosyltransferase